MTVDNRTDAVAAGAGSTPPVNVTVCAMDLFVPTIPDANPEGIERRFKYSTLKKIEGERDYKRMCIVREELCRKSIVINSTFRGGKHGHLGSVSKPALYHTESGHNWVVPASNGVYPVFPAGATNDEKKKEVAEFIDRKTYISVAYIVEELLKNQFLEAIDEKYIIKLRQGVLRYDSVKLLDLIDHVFNNYAKIDNLLVIKYKKEFEEPPDLTCPIDVYFMKQEEC